jgi:hypothetical protein
MWRSLDSASGKHTHAPPSVPRDMGMGIAAWTRRRLLDQVCVGDLLRRNQSVTTLLTRTLYANCRRELEFLELGRRVLPVAQLLAHQQASATRAAHLSDAKRAAASRVHEVNIGGRVLDLCAELLEGFTD